VVLSTFSQPGPWRPVVVARLARTLGITKTPLLASYAPKAYSLNVLTVVESPIFQRLWPRYWDEEERADFAAFIALNPEAGSVIRGSGGVRKVRWAREGTGKSGGVRIVYLTRNDAGEVYLLTLYAKSESENISLNTLKEIRRALEI
jgi:RelE toxin of RelE / RelB toxin-antitoxin system